MVVSKLLLELVARVPVVKDILKIYLDKEEPSSNHPYLEIRHSNKLGHLHSQATSPISLECCNNNSRL